MRAVKLRAVQDNRTLQETMAELLRRGLAASTNPSRVRLPLIQCAHPATEETEITPERAAQILLEQDLP